MPMCYHEIKHIMAFHSFDLPSEYHPACFPASIRHMPISIVSLNRWCETMYHPCFRHRPANSFMSAVRKYIMPSSLMTTVSSDFGFSLLNRLSL